MLPRPVVIGIAILVGIAWAANFVVGIVDPARANPSVNAIFAIVVGAAMALGGDKQKKAVRRAVIRRKLADLIYPPGSQELDGAPEDEGPGGPDSRGDAP